MPGNQRHFTLDPTKTVGQSLGPFKDLRDKRAPRAGRNPGINHAGQVKLAVNPRSKIQLLGY